MDEPAKIELVDHDLEQPAVAALPEETPDDGLHWIQVGWNPNTQTVEQVKFNGGPTGEFRTWGFIQAVFDLAKEYIKGAAAASMQRQAEQAMMQQMQAGQLAERIRRNGR